MYTSFFGFEENPFSLTPDPHYLYLSRHHQAAFDHLLYGINERKGFIVITGGIGTGKTTLCRALLSTLDPSTKTALVLNAYISDMELLKTINEEFGIDNTSSAGTKKDYIDSLNRFLLENYTSRGNAVLLIDEAQNLSHKVLEQIRMLSNLETEKEKLVQIVLVGQLELKELLSSPSLKQLDERIVVRFDLKPLDRHDVQGYVEHRLVVAGGKGNVRFTKGAFGAVFAYSRGNPRRINAVCDRALLIAYSKDQSAVSKKIVEKAVQDISGGFRTDSGRERSWFSGKMAALSALLLCLIIGVGLAGRQVRKAWSPADSDNPAAHAPLIEEGTMPERGATEEAEMTAALPAGIPALSSEMESKSESPLPGEPSGPEKTGEGTHGISIDEDVLGSRSDEASSLAGGADLRAVPVFLDEQASVGELFRAYYTRGSGSGRKPQDDHLRIYSLRAEPALFVTFKKPFRVRMTGPPGALETGDPTVSSAPRHLLVVEVAPDGVVAVDADGRDRRLTREFLMDHWGYEVCWIYPFKEDAVDLVRGKYGPEVIELQRRLNDAGYPVEITGIYDEATSGKVVMLQRDFGLEPDGIVGQRTRGLLYQISN